MTKQGIATIISSYSNNFIVYHQNNKYSATAKSKRSGYVVGDKVIVEIDHNQQARIISLLPRQSLIFRQSITKNKLIASNVSQLCIVISHQPKCNLYFLDCCLVFCESQQISPLILVNKSDLPCYQQFFEDIKNIYHHQLGYNLLAVSAFDDLSLLIKNINNHNNLLIGQSGVGKSSLTARILNKPVKTGNLSVTGRGCHTTTSSNLYFLNNNATIIDSPGLDHFGLSHINPHQLSNYFIEFKPYLSACKFRNCLHDQQYNCAILKALDNKQINSSRYNSYLTLISHLKKIKV